MALFTLTVQAGDMEELLTNLKDAGDALERRHQQEQAEEVKPEPKKRTATKKKATTKDAPATDPVEEQPTETPTTEPQSTEGQEEQEQQPAYTLAEVTSKVAAWAKGDAVRVAKVKNILNNYGVPAVSEAPVEAYSELIALTEGAD